ncbi:hypothetical protein [Luteimonas cellulosilyticus]|uniref:hypothetical protein n=1 Tax=Luteimonas cellulosilyticus TaxID=2683586 RepID=UPI003CCD157C
MRIWAPRADRSTARHGDAADARPIRETFHLHRQVGDPLNAAHAAHALFVCHLLARLCEPVSVLLTGLSTWLDARRQIDGGERPGHSVRVRFVSDRPADRDMVPGDSVGALVGIPLLLGVSLMPSMRSLRNARRMVTTRHCLRRYL